MIIGNIAGVTLRVIVLSLMKTFKPKFFFSFQYLNKMLGYTIWTLLNGLFVWLVAWLDTFLIGRYLNDYHLGIYKNSISMITTIFGIITASITPVLFSTLSKLQKNDVEFKKFYLGIQKAIACLIIPMGLGLFMYREFATYILFGEKWGDAVDVIGINALTMVFRTLFVSLNGDVFRSKGCFKTPLFIEIIDIIVTLPVCVYVLNNNDFMTYVYVKALLRLVPIIPEFIMLKLKCKIDFSSIFKNVYKYFVSSAVMGLFIAMFKMVDTSFFWNVISIIFCVFIYFGTLMCIPKERHFILKFFQEKAKIRK